MREQGAGLTIEELAERVGVPVRTVRFYITEGLLPGPGGRGKAASYGEEHLLRLLLVRRLVEQHVPLKEIVQRLSRLSLGEIRDVLAEEVRRESALRQAPAQQSPKDYISGLLAHARSPRLRAPTPLQPSQTWPIAGEDSERENQPAGAYYSMSNPLPPVADRGSGGGARSDPTTDVQSWQRWELAPGVELHVRLDATARQRRLIERLLKAAGIRTVRSGE